MWISSRWTGVYGETRGSENGPAGVAGFHLANRGPGIFGKGAPGGRLEGDVELTGDIRLANADCAKDFDVEPCEGGEVV